MKAIRILAAMLLAGFSSAVAQAQMTWPFWSHYTEHFVSADGRVIDPDRGSMTTSEGQSYALFFALVANDRATFQRVLSWTESNLAQGDLSKNLPGWSWGHKDDQSWGLLDANTASDADLWIAYSLEEAGLLWGNSDYSRKGSSLLTHIAQEEVADVPHAGPFLLAGKTGFHPSSDEAILNPSYLPLPLLFAASRFAPKGPWKQMALALPDWLAEVSPAGFAMDWVKCEPRGCSPVSGPANSTGPAQGSYDAIRVYLWAGMTAKETPGAAKVLATFAQMLRYVKAHSAPPESVGADGNILSASAPKSFDAALIPFLESSGERALAAQLQKDVVAQISGSTGLLGSPARYYDQNLALFALGWQEQRFQFGPDGMLRVRWKK